ncbi:MAG: hypothetical protein JJU46_08585 [Balneolaceae bacterium]|nr:hypothetical protein [Balneolaceae bacterium]MCH8549831.1 hypothetical protein [Balneolaceae bacterium]
MKITTYVETFTMKLKRLSLFLVAIALPFALMSCSEDSIPTIELPDDGNGNGNGDIELVYGIQFETEDGGIATFTVDLSEVSGFDPDEYDVYIAGAMVGWTEPGTNDEYRLVLIVDEDTELPVVPAQAEGEGVEYKYFSNFVDEGWDGGEWAGDPNRSATLEDGVTVEDVWGEQPE